MNWKEHEDRIFKYLRRRYSDDGNIHFLHQGGTDSTSIDIKVVGKLGKEMCLEVKSYKSQAGQFVIEDVEGQFEFKRNSQAYNPTFLQQSLIDYLNRMSFTSPITQSAIVIPYNNNKIAELVKEHYRKKNVKFFITGQVDIRPYVVRIIPIEEIHKAFVFYVNLRRKRSGTRPVPQARYDEALYVGQQKIKQLGLHILNIEKGQRHLVFKTNCNYKIKKRELYFSHPYTFYFLSQRECNSEFEMKQRSSTNNINIIYSIEYNNYVEGVWEQTFVKELREL